MQKTNNSTDHAETGLPLSRMHFIAMVASLMALNALAIDIILPAFPALVSSFSIEDPTSAQFVLLAYVLGFGGAQPIYGPLSDRYGRRIPLFVGLTIYVVFAIAALFAPNFAFLLAARFLQGLGAAGTRVIALAVVRDTHSGRRMASTMSLVMMVFMIVPVIAPLAGQGLVLFGNWHVIFLFMGVFGAAVLAWCWWLLPETLAESKRRPLTTKSVREAFYLTATERIAFYYTLATAVFFGALFSFLNMAQPLYADVYGLGPYFPFAFGVTGLLMAASSYANSRLVGWLGQRRLSHGAMIAFFGMSFILTAIAWDANPPLWLFMLMLSLILPLFGLIAANLNSIAMEPLGSVAGTGSAVIGFAQTAGGGLVGTLIGQFYEGRVVTLSLGFMVVSLTSLTLIAVAEKGRLMGVSESEEA